VNFFQIFGNLFEILLYYKTIPSFSNIHPPPPPPQKKQTNALVRESLINLIDLIMIILITIKLITSFPNVFEQNI
jgi:hypothetical protein